MIGQRSRSRKEHRLSIFSFIRLHPPPPGQAAYKATSQLPRDRTRSSACCWHSFVRMRCMRSSTSSSCGLAILFGLFLSTSKPRLTRNIVKSSQKVRRSHMPTATAGIDTMQDESLSSSLLVLTTHHMPHHQSAPNDTCEQVKRKRRHPFKFSTRVR